jgi:hypothetical protein
VLKQVHGLAEPFPRSCLFFSFTDGHHRAHVAHAAGSDLDARIWAQRAAAITDLAIPSAVLASGWLRIDWVDAVNGARHLAGKEALHELIEGVLTRGLPLA